jgi:hypothetical protein
MSERPPATLIALRLAQALEAAGIPYAIGGAIALGVWAIPRATYDVDLDIFLEAPELPRVLPVLRSAGCEFEDEPVLRAAEERGAFEVYCEGVRVDGFINAIPLYESAKERCREGPLEGHRVKFLSPEDLALFKLLFFRSKDLLDLERLIAIQGEAFDEGYVRRWLIDIVGEDERLQALDRILALTRRS